MRLIVSCEHASNAVPEALEDLGLPRETLDSHVAWDPGAKEVAAAVAKRFSAPAFFGSWTRLVADLNRSPDTPPAVPEIAFGERIPRNQGLSAAERDARIERYHDPYWQEVETSVREALVEGSVLHLSIHSFTEVFAGQRRPTSLGVMFDPLHKSEHILGEAILSSLSADGWQADENLPYDGRADALVTSLRKRLPEDRYAGIEIEISHKHLDALDKIATSLIAAIEPFLSDT